MVGPHADPSPDFFDLAASGYGDPPELVPRGRHHRSGGSGPEADPGSGRGDEGWPAAENPAGHPAGPVAATSNTFRAAPYALTRGRTQPSSNLDMMSLVRATGRARGDEMGYSHAQALLLCQKPVSVAEIAAEIGQPITVAKVILSDLIEFGAVIASAPPMPDTFTNDPNILEAVLDGLRNLK